MIKSRYIFPLLALVTVFYFAPANAQNTTTKKTPAKTKSTNKKAGATAMQDTTKKGEQAKSTGNNTNNSLSEEIVVTTAYKPVLADAVKIRRNPNLDDKTPFKAPLTYVTLDKRLERNTDIRQLEAMKMPVEQDSIPTNNYARVGLGNLKTTFGEVYINNGRDNALQVGGYARHFAQSGSSINKQNEIRDEVGIFGKVVTDYDILRGSINYNRRGTYFYGFNPTNPPTTFNPEQQHFSTISAEGEIAKRYSDADNEFSYAVKANGYSWSNALQAKETNIIVTGFLNETIKQFYAGLGSSLDISTQNDNSYSYSNSILRLNPYLKFQSSFYKIDAGISIVKEFGLSSRIFIFPAAKLELQVIPSYVRFFAELNGDVNKSSLRNFSDINPFLEPNIQIKNSVDRLDIALGLKGTIAPGLGFKATIFRNSVENLPLFVNDYTAGTYKFKVIYDNGTAHITGLNGELDYKVSDDLDIFGRVEFKDYKLASEVEPWNLPKFKLMAGTSIHFTKQLSITGTLLYRGGTYDQNNPPLTGSAPTLASISSFADLSGGLDYKITNRISIFGQVNNILSGATQVWLYYPNYGFNIFAGVGIHF